LRLNFHVTEDRLARLAEQSAFANLSVSKKAAPKARAAEETAGRELQERILAALVTLPDELLKDRAVFSDRLHAALEQADLKLKAPVLKAILAALGERDETAAPCLDDDGQPEPDSELRDYENVPLRERVDDYFRREVLPHAPDAWINPEFRDAKDKEIGKVGYEINFNRYFYQYQPPRPLAVIDAEIRTVEQDILGLLKEVMT
jgi:type I restriction enzyme M protein